MNFVQKAGFTIAGVIIGSALLWVFIPHGIPGIKANRPTTTIAPGSATSPTTATLEASGNCVEVFFYSRSGDGGMASPTLKIQDAGVEKIISPGYGYTISSAALSKTDFLTVFYNGTTPYDNLTLVLDPDRSVFNGIYSKVNDAHTTDYGFLLIGDSWKLFHPNSTK